MNKTMIAIATLLLCAEGAHAAEEEKPAPAAEEKNAKPDKNGVGSYDEDGNGRINGTEVRMAGDAYKEGAKLGAHDTNHDNELSDAEIAKIRTGHEAERAVKPGKVFIQPKRKGKGKGKR